MVFLDKLGWPIETIKGRWFHNFLRRLIHTRKIKKGRWDGYNVKKSLSDDMIDYNDYHDVDIRN